MSLKDKGNQAFKCQKYKQAIKLYDEYVVQSHPDNKNAFFNMALCYSKLKEHQKSIEACKSALALDSTYEKAYYRLMKEYFQIKNSYEIFINARLYIKNEKDQSSAQIIQAQEYIRIYKDYFINRVAKQQMPKKLEDKDQIFELIQPLNPKNQSRVEFNQQIDKYPNQWIEEWAQDIQSEEAKWLEIQYIIQELDYSTGISLAYFYLNQIKDTHKRKEVAERIRIIKAQVNVEQTAMQEEFCIENSTETPETQTQDRDTVSQPFKEQANIASYQGSKESQTKQIEQRLQVKVQKNQQRQQKQPQKEAKAQRMNKMQELLQKKSQNKKIHEEKQTNDIQAHSVKPKQQISINNTLKEIKTTQKTNQIQQQKVLPTTATKQQQKSEEQLESLYKLYCGNLEKTKDIFVEVYKSIYQILKGKQTPTTTGKLLILIKKRVKKFKMIVASFSDNQQKAIMDLLSKKGMQEYAVDFAPKYHKI